MFSSKNRLTAAMIEEQAWKLKDWQSMCRGVMAIECNDSQCMGYDQVCGVVMAYRVAHKSNTDALYAVMTDMIDNEYIKGFIKGWDAEKLEKKESKNPEYDLGWDDGYKAVNHWSWENRRRRAAAVGR